MIASKIGVSHMFFFFGIYGDYQISKVGKYDVEYDLKALFLEVKFSWNFCRYIFSVACVQRK